ncbi:MAG: DUF6106 family protein [Lachnospiraceae bacterium]|jgi:hypothetical protein|nr:DUF6106 family protein [Lachnospiraceae bacterium]MEE3460713.1 DUF6106 family protein [Lachnospiraceae bacterium]
MFDQTSSYSETVVKGSIRGRDKSMRVFLIALMVILMVFVIFLGLIMKGLGTLIIAIGVIADIVIYNFLPGTSVDFEYVFVEGDISFDKVSNGEKRKTVVKTSMENVELVAPEGSDYLADFKNVPMLYDFRSTDKQAKNYVMITKLEKGNAGILFTPDEKLFQNMEFRKKSVVKRGEVTRYDAAHRDGEPKDIDVTLFQEGFDKPGESSPSGQASSDDTDVN